MVSALNILIIQNIIMSCVYISVCLFIWNLCSLEEEYQEFTEQILRNLYKIFEENSN